MFSSKPNEKLLKIFSGIRCLNKDQLPRYLDGRLTDVEKHLMEQHLTDCDLCFGALQALEKETGNEKYLDLTTKLQRYIHQTIEPVSHVQKVAQYTRKERTKENLLVYFWLIAFAILGVGSVYVMRGHMRNQPVANKEAATTLPSKTDSPAIIPAQQPIVGPEHTPAASQTSPAVTSAKPAVPAPPPARPVMDSAARVKAAAAKVQQQKKTADSIRKQVAFQKLQDSLKKEVAKKDDNRSDTEVKTTPVTPELKSEPKPAPKKTAAEPVKKEAAPEPVSSDEYLYKAAMVYQQQGNINEAIERYKRIESISSGKYVEMARYQLAICYRSKGQAGKARRMFKEVIRMDGALKNNAQQALDNM
ncbi:tetratricopeptide repeat protein [Chitinophaga sp. MM2321]|uniref:tetratricopeptide repeat protein n=1 Tax=Chitinophaga sp. MM2321 TaxID=3137178 RepID=UPI0032D59AAE